MAYRIKQLSKRYGDTLVLDGLSLELPKNAVSVVLGPSGCGKTSLLNILAGIDGDFQGELDGFTGTRASYAFQEDRLLPWRSAQDNVALVLRARHGGEEADRLALEALRSVGLENDAEKLPGALSGGMRKRVALARAFAYPSELLLMDEPFSSLDLKTRIAIMDLFLALRRASGKTALIVTHDVREAIYLGDTVYCLSDKPSRVRDRMELTLPRDARAYVSAEAAGIEARLYESIVG
jgi:NitT/TauT family transport system ATP-binding protein